MASTLEGGEVALKMDGKPATNSYELGLLMDKTAIEAEGGKRIDDFHKQSLLMGDAKGQGKLARVALGEHKEELRGKVRYMINRLFQGASVLTVFHEMWHGVTNNARRTGIVTRDEYEQFAKAANSIYVGKYMRDGQRKALLPDNYDSLSLEDQDKALNEAHSWIAEMEILRTRKRSGDGKTLQVGGGIVSRNLLALARITPGATSKFRILLDAAKGLFGLTSARVLLLNKAFADGTLNMEEYEGFLAKLTGNDVQHDYDKQVEKEQQELYGG